MANALNLGSPEAIIGLRDSDLSLHSKQDLMFHYQKDQLALQGQTSRFVHRHQDQLYFVVKKPMLDFNQCICGVIYQCQVIDSEQLHSPSHASVSYNIKPDTNPYSLSKRELQCMFYILRGKSNREIADELKLSKRTIDFYMENIKNKFGCLSKSELIIKAIEIGYKP